MLPFVKANLLKQETLLDISVLGAASLFQEFHTLEPKALIESSILRLLDSLPRLRLCLFVQQNSHPITDPLKSFQAR